MWGASFGGCHVFAAAAQDGGILCIVSQLAFVDGEEIVTGKMNDEQKDAFLLTLHKMTEKQKNTGKEMFVGITRVLSDNQSVKNTNFPGEIVLNRTSYHNIGRRQ